MCAPLFPPPLPPQALSSQTSAAAPLNTGGTVAISVGLVVVVVLVLCAALVVLRRRHRLKKQVANDGTTVVRREDAAAGKEGVVRTGILKVGMVSPAPVFVPMKGDDHSPVHSLSASPHKTGTTTFISLARWRVCACVWGGCVCGGGVGGGGGCVCLCVLWECVFLHELCRARGVSHARCCC